MGRPKVGSTPLMVKVPPDLLNGIDRWIAEDGAMNGDAEMTRPEAVRRLATQALQGMGLLPCKRD